MAKLRIEFDSTGFFLRKGELKLKHDAERKLFSNNPVMSRYLEFENNLNDIETNNFRANRFELIINNKDNPPLPIKNVQFFAPKLYLTARLERGKQYEVKMGNPDMKAPQYDLEYNNQIKVVGTLTVSETPTAYEASPAEKSKKRMLLWGSLGLCVLVLGGMAFSMVRKA